MEILQAIIFLIYIAAGWWAANRTVYANKVLFGSSSSIFSRKLATALLFGWALIPVALIKNYFSSKNQ